MRAIKIIALGYTMPIMRDFGALLKYAKRNGKNKYKNNNLNIENYGFRKN